MEGKSRLVHHRHISIENTTVFSIHLTLFSFLTVSREGTSRLVHPRHIEKKCHCVHYTQEIDAIFLSSSLTLLH